MLLFSAESGELLAMMNASAIHRYSHSCVSVWRQSPGPSGCLQSRDVGSGVQARSHLVAMSEVRPSSVAHSDRPLNTAELDEAMRRTSHSRLKQLRVSTKL